IQIFANASSSRPNQNIFYQPDLEGDVPQYHVEIYGGFANQILNGRWEATTPTVYFSSYSAGTPSEGNRIEGGYDSNLIVATEDANANYNTVITQGTRKEAAY